MVLIIKTKNPAEGKKNRCCAVCAKIDNSGEIDFKSCPQPKIRGGEFCNYHLQCKENTNAYILQKIKLEELGFEPWCEIGDMIDKFLFSFFNL